MWERTAVGEGIGATKRNGNQGVQPNVITYNALISACEKGLQWGKALELLSEMKTQGFQPDVSFYNSPCEAAEKCKKSGEILGLGVKRDYEPLIKSCVRECEELQYVWTLYIYHEWYLPNGLHDRWGGEEEKKITNFCYCSYRTGRFGVVRGRNFRRFVFLLFPSPILRHVLRVGGLGMGRRWVRVTS